MNINKSELDDFFARLEALELDKKNIAEEMKETVAAFANSLDLNKKSVNKAYKDWKQAKKDREEFCLIDLEADQLLVTVFPEFSTGSMVEED